MAILQTSNPTKETDVARKSKNQGTLVTFLLDRTGSMSAIAAQTISAFNEYLRSLKESRADIAFTLLQFDSQSLDKLYVAQPVKSIPELTHETFKPRASTPLIDSAYATIKAVEGQEKAKGKKIVICFQTDGEENCSSKHTWEELKSLIGEKTKEGWQFNFMGAGIDAYQQAGMMGIGAAATMAYDNNPDMTAAAFRGLASNTVAYAMGSARNTNYTMGQKAASGDRFHTAADVDLNNQPTGAMDDLAL